MGRQGPRAVRVGTAICIAALSVGGPALAVTGSEGWYASEAGDFPRCSTKRGARKCSANRIGVTSRSQPSMYFRNCSEARAAGVAPIMRGNPGYAAHLDRDHDGIACEPYRGR